MNAYIHMEEVCEKSIVTFAQYFEMMYNVENSQNYYKQGVKKYV